MNYSTGIDLVVHAAGPFQRKEHCNVLEVAISKKVGIYRHIHMYNIYVYVYVYDVYGFVYMYVYMCICKCICMCLTSGNI